MACEKYTVNVGETINLFVEVYDFNEVTDFKLGDLKIEVVDSNPTVSVFMGDNDWDDSIGFNPLEYHVYTTVFTDVKDSNGKLIRVLNNDPAFDKEAYLKGEV